MPVLSGADLDGQLIGKICEKKGSDIKLWDSATRAAKGGARPRRWLARHDRRDPPCRAPGADAHARCGARSAQGRGDLSNDPQFLSALEAVLEVLPPSRNFVGFDVATGDAKSAADDFDALGEASPPRLLGQSGRTATTLALRGGGCLTLLRDTAWRLKYTPDDGDLVRLFYVPALRSATRYDRLTGYFSARALALAARGVEGLIVNNGRMRLIVGCTLGEEEVAAIERGESLRDAVERITDQDADLCLPIRERSMRWNLSLGWWRTAFST